MKISKLFHWLYAILMFLPILVFIPNAFYYGFNHEAVAQEKIEQVPVYYQSNEVNSIDDIHIGNIYRFHYVSNVQTNPSVINYEIDSFYIVNTFNSSSGEGTLLATYPYIRITDSVYFLPYSLLDNNRVLRYTGSEIIVDIVIKTLTNLPDINFFSICNELYIKEYQPVTTNMSITDSMSYAWKSVWQNDLFSWTNETFLKEPFVYITDLFSIPSDNVLINALSYWLDISIIWLVFDVILYVPLLTHRWLDKGIVE